MEIIQIEEKFLRFRFPPRPEKHFGFNVYAFLGEGECLLLDTGFEDHGREVNAYLSELGCPPRGAIISHFHHDHIFGLKKLPGVEILGSPRFQETLDLYTRPDAQPRFRPHRLITEGETLSFGSFHLRFLLMPGHAACNLYTIINERYLHVGDDLMASNEGTALLPSVELARVGDHIASLERLRTMANFTFLLSHGPPISGEVEILTAIDNRLKYLKAVAASTAPITLEQALQGCTIPFLHTEWHAGMYQDD
jgi:glyoxylase-like metal-dependent hydrolase (beta-lactamase superfamily II)